MDITRLDLRGRSIYLRSVTLGINVVMKKTRLWTGHSEWKLVNVKFWLYLFKLWKLFPNISIVLNQDLNLSLQREFEAMTWHKLQLSCFKLYWILPYVSCTALLVFSPMKEFDNPLFIRDIPNEVPKDNAYGRGKRNQSNLSRQFALC